MKHNRRPYLLKFLITPLAMLACSLPALADVNKPIRIATSNWAETEAMVNIAKVILEKKLNQKVDLVLADAGAQYQGVARGDLDLMMMGWLPTTHKEYYVKHKDNIVDMGVLFQEARLGWAVPDYVPVSEVKTIDDLKRPDVKAKLQRRLQGIEPGGGLMINSEKTLKAYGLNDYTLVTASETAMLAALKRAYEQKQWIAVTAWSPHWKFSNWKLRYLEDPKGMMGGPEQIHALASKGFQQKYPAAAKFISRMKIAPDDLQSVMLRARKVPVQAAAEEFVNTHTALVQQWTEGAK